MESGGEVRAVLQEGENWMSCCLREVRAYKEEMRPQFGCFRRADRNPGSVCGWSRSRDYLAAGAGEPGN